MAPKSNRIVDETERRAVREERRERTERNEPRERMSDHGPYYHSDEYRGGEYRSSRDYDEDRAPLQRAYGRGTDLAHDPRDREHDYDPRAHGDHGRVDRVDMGGTRMRGPYSGKGPKSYTRSDDRIREIACELLTDDDRVDASHIEVAVKHGEIMLGGTVEDRQQKRYAEEAVEHIRGVKDVQNHIRIKHHTS